MALLCLVAAIPQGLLGTPDMHVAGNGSSAQSLRWFADRSDDALPVASAISVPLWVYKVAMLAWAIWLANAVVGWLRYGFAAWTRDGHWRAHAAQGRGRHSGRDAAAAAAIVNVRDLLAAATQHLGGADARLDAELLLAHVLGVSRAWLYAWPEHEPDATAA